MNVATQPQRTFTLADFARVTSAGDAAQLLRDFERAGVVERVDDERWRFTTKGRRIAFLVRAVMP